MHLHARRIALVLSLLLPAALASAAVQLPAIISDHMVLQSGISAPIWGWALPGEKVSVTLSDASGRTLAAAETRAAANSKWMVRLSPLPAGGPYELTVTGANTLKVSDVLVGEVWLASGQSNMSFKLREVTDAKRELAAANYPQIRMFKTLYRWTDEPQIDTEGEWKVCTPELSTDYAAVAYFFARSLNKSLQVPVGIINSSVGGTAIEGWTPRETLVSTPALHVVLDKQQEALAKYPSDLAAFNEAHRRWQATTQEAAGSASMPSEPKAVVNPAENPSRPTALYNGKIAPVVPYGIRGAIWYQGEQNELLPGLYRVQFPALIQGWRQAWGQGDFPFLFVQLPHYRPVQTDPVEEKDLWPPLREAQACALALPHTSMAVTIDFGEAGNVHPANKQDVGRRLALLALHDVYGQAGVVAEGPQFRDMAVEGGKARIRFTHAEGLMALSEPPLTAGTLSAELPALHPADRVDGFGIAGADGKFVWAQAEIQGDSVVVWSEAVPHPVSVRYAWANNPRCNLYNSAGLPAAPFRTDQPGPKGLDGLAGAGR